MGSLSARGIWFAGAAVCGLVLLAAAARAQPAPSPPAPAASSTDRNSPAYSASVETYLVVRPDLTAVADHTVRYKVLRESAIRTLGQLNLSFVESLNALEVIEAYTEKADGRKIAVEPGNILTRDAATGLNAIYRRDAKVRTLIFSDVEVGDTVVYLARVQWTDRRFPGHFNYQMLFSRAAPYGTSLLTVDAPQSLPLRVHIKGDGLAHETIETGEGRRHKFSYRAKSWTPEEPGAVSNWDRDPQVVITTIKDLSELGASYWSSMKDPDRVDPEIQALAEEITKGIADRRDQVVAIDRWVKKNIRYVLVFLGSAGITPNPPSQVLRNKFGDCKDHVALMGALLRAKGINSEQVLVNVGNAYRLPELPIPFFNHVMLYFPELRLYTDPTASQAAFGILPLGSYDKPVLHISSAGGRPARTPPMQPQDHTATAKTTVTIGADGTVKGTTRQISTGVFATSARGRATQIESQGREKFAEALLRSLGRPGTGIFEPAIPSDLSEPYSVQGEFSQHQKLQMPLSGPRDIPIGIPIHARPGIGPFGQRVPGRQTDFVCYPGQQVEETEIRFAPGLPLPKAMSEAAIENKYFSYQSSYAIKGRTLLIRREFKSKVAGEVCVKQMEAEISEPLERVMRSLRRQMVF